MHSATIGLALIATPVKREVFESSYPFDERRVGAAAIYCSDGRFGEQMDEFLHRGLELPRYDRVAVPGGCACLAGHTSAYYEKSALERQMRFLIDEHKLARVVLIAHDGCAFYKDVWTGMRTVEQLQRTDLAKAAEAVRMWFRGIEVNRYFARKAQGKVVFENWDEP
jgi:hypothetical protein